MTGQARVVHACHRGLVLQPAGQLQCAFGLGAHADVQGFQALEHHPGIEGRQRHARALEHRQELVRHQLLAGTQGTRHDPALPIQVLGARVHHHVSAESHRTLQRRRGKAVVHRQQRAGLMRNGRQRSNVTDFGQGIGGRFGEQQPGVGTHGRLPGREVSLRNKGGFHAELGQVRADQLDRGAKHRLRAHDVVAGLEQGHAHHQDGRHARGGGDRSLGAFQRRQALLETGNRRIAITAISEAILIARKPARRGFRRRLHIPTGEVERLGVLAILASLGRGAHRERVAVQGFGKGARRHVQSTWLGSARRELSSSPASTPGRPELSLAMSSAVMSPVT